MRAVVWVDTIQSVFMLAGLCCLFIVGAIKAGGFSKVWETASEHGRLNFFK